MNGIKGYISIREASYRWGVSTNTAPKGGSPAHPGSGVHGRSRKMRRNRPTRAFKDSIVIPAGQAPDGYPSAWEASAKRR